MCVHCSGNTPDAINIGNFTLTWDINGNATIDSVSPDWAILPELNPTKLNRFIERNFGKREQDRPLKTDTATGHMVFDFCPVCGAGLGR